MSKQKTVFEVMSGPDGIRLNRSQKRVLRKVADAINSEVAAEQLARAEDARNLMAAAKILAKYGYVDTEPDPLMDDDEPQTIELTDKGREAVEEYDITNDPELVTDKEQELSAPEEQPPFEPAQQAGGVAPGMDVPPTQLQGPGVGLEFSSFFRDINDLAVLRERKKN